jgi:hypothetical protein
MRRLRSGLIPTHPVRAQLGRRPDHAQTGSWAGSVEPTILSGCRRSTRKQSRFGNRASSDPSAQPACRIRHNECSLCFAMPVVKYAFPDRLARNSFRLSVVDGTVARVL